ncbi:ribosome biogenesis GTPase Der [Thiospirochaeta perfilievii]|uniref:GTPase Der n=1 Tax=Thiospirochaeta perfilievii TaxID=252967 RepID=A0A5C1Q822_9SPIO|nr:ribosome biogenesis GTPase Der [Thiospirochaeta perfilievii]QEN03621.1 ribosome biogenesis GTPase Der [Thiospirochaeta perfilievii]
MGSNLSNKILPKVVVVGRPNVGKSTLFNRFLRERKAITDPTPGVTRDPIEASCIIGNRELLLIDTGGFKLERDDEFDELVSKKAVQMIGEGDLILFLMDVMDVTPEDEAFIELLRPYEEKVILVANKVDTVEKENEVWNLYSYGFSTVLGISAEHNRNIYDLEDAITSRLEFVDIEGKELHNSPDIKITILGKPNAGKSTLANALTKSGNSLVSDIAGTTRDVVEGHFKYEEYDFQILDTAGIRRKSKVKEDVEYYSVNRAIKTIADADIVYLLIDVEEGLTDQDKKIASQIIKHGKGVILVLNKWDVMKELGNDFNAVQDRVRFLFPVLGFAPILNISALKKRGFRDLLKKTVELYNELEKRVETNHLNDALAEWQDFNPAPIVKGKAIKCRYLTQVSVSPLKFVLFVNREKNFPDFYKRYILNQIRKEFGFKNVPITLDLKES